MTCTCYEAGRNPLCPVHGQTAGDIGSAATPSRRLMVMVYEDESVPETSWFQRVVRRRKTRSQRNVVYVGLVVDGTFERSLNRPSPDTHIIARDPMALLAEVGVVSGPWTDASE